MKNFALLAMLGLTIFAGSCTKNIGTPLAFQVDTVANAYINNNDSLALPIQVRFLAGNDNEVVKVTIAGLPANVTMRQDTISGTGNFVATFKLFANNAIIGNYPVDMVTYSSSNGYRSYRFNFGVVHNNCSSYLTGNFSGSSACKATNYSFTAISTALTDTSISINNIGGYGANTNTIVRLNCNTDSVYISRQGIGNGITMWGQGHFTATQIVISYIALNVPGSYNDTCTMVLNK